MVYKTVATNAPARPNPINNMPVLILGRLRRYYKGRTKRIIRIIEKSRSIISYSTER